MNNARLVSGIFSVVLSVLAFGYAISSTMNGETDIVPRAVALAVLMFLGGVSGIVTWKQNNKVAMLVIAGFFLAGFLVARGQGALTMWSWFSAGFAMIFVYALERMAKKK